MTNPEKRNLDWRLIALLVFIGAAVGLMTVLPRLIDRGPRESDEYRANLAKIENMTDAERERLKRRIDRFYEEKTEAEREAMRALDADLKQQSEREAKALRAVMKRYNEWLTSLTPFDREKFRKQFRETKSLDDRVALVQTSIQKEDDRRFVNSLDGRSRMVLERELKREKDVSKHQTIIAEFRDSMRSGSRNRRRRFEPLSTPELDQAIALIEKAAPLDMVERDHLKVMSPNRRRLNVMILAMQKNRQQRMSKNGKSGFLESSQLAMVVKSSNLDDEFKEKLVQAGRSRWNRRYGILSLITGSLYHERRERRGKPTEDELNDFLQAMDSDERDKLMKYRGSEKRYHLKRAYFDGGEDGRDYREFRSLVMQTMYRFGRRGGPSSGRKKKFPAKRPPGKENSPR